MEKKQTAVQWLDNQLWSLRLKLKGGLRVAANVSGLNAAPCRNLKLTTAFDWGCVLALVMCCKIYGL